MDNKNNNDRFKNRRTLAYASFVVICLVMGLCFYFYERVENIEALITTFYSGMFAILLGYYGVATWDHHIETKNRKEDK